MPSPKRKKRVLHIITRLIVGGAQENTVYTCQLLDRERYEVDLVIGPQLGAEGELVSTVDREKVGLTVIDPLVREVSPAKEIAAYRALYSFIKKGGYDVVHTHSSKAGILGRIAAHRARVPVIVHTVHGWGFHDRMGALEKNIFVTAEKFCEPMTDRLVVVTDLDIEKGLSLGIGSPEKYVKIYSAIDLDKFMNVKVDLAAKKRELGLDPELPVVGCVGRLSPQKAPEIFVRMAAEVLKKRDKVNFIFVGGGPLRAEVERLIGELRLGDRIFLVGLRRDVPELLRVMDVFVLLSLWEGLPRVFAQAMAAGLPIVASNVGGAAEVIRDGVNGFLVPPGEHVQAAGKVLSLLDDENLRKRMAAAPPDFLRENFCVKRMVEKIDSLYVELLKQKKAIR